MDPEAAAAVLVGEGNPQLWQYFSRLPKSDYEHIGEVDRSRVVGPLSSETAR